MHSTARESGSTPCKELFAGGLHQRPLPGSRHPSEDSHAQRNPLAQSFGRDAGFRLDFDVLANVVKNANADVVEAEVLLDMAHDLEQHLFRVFTRDRSLRDAVEKRELAGAALLLAQTTAHFPPRLKPARQPSA